MMRLLDKKAVITGASSGIGKAIAVAFAREGADVIVNYLHCRDMAEWTVKEIIEAGGNARAIQADVSRQEDVDRLAKASQEVLGRVDIWVNNAGADILTGEGAQLHDSEKLGRLLAVDLEGTIKCCWALAPRMQQQGAGVIINMSWDLATHGFEGRNPQMFGAVKAGVLGFSRSLAKSYAPEVRVNILAPGWIKTAYVKEVMTEDYLRARIGEIPLHRFGTPEEVAEAAVFLACDESAYITGEVIHINGGLV
ncbi:MAG: SDR family NAD(P)-dependent oxidoreductase [Gammaproteobacteria bacterium]